VYFYQNEIQKASNYNGGTPIPTTLGDMTGGNFTIGNTAASFDGSISNFRIYTRVLSVEEISAIYNKEKSHYGL